MQHRKQENMGMDVYYNYQAQQRYAFLHSFIEFWFSSNLYLKRIGFQLNVNLLNLHFKFRITVAQYAFEQEDTEMEKNLSN